jgi:hypothetical protein
MIGENVGESYYLSFEEDTSSIYGAGKNRLEVEVGCIFFNVK